MYVVSANYRDREDQANRWLLRDKEQSVDEYQLRQAVVLNGVKFKDSNAYERGFGCSVVAEAEAVETAEGVIEKPQNAVQLYFDGSTFRERKQNDHDIERPIFEAKQLILSGDGCMYAIL